METRRAIAVAAALAATVLSALRAAAPARADGPCLFQGDWNCSGQPQWKGQLQQTWEAPPYTWPNNQLQCNPYTTVCYPISRP